MPVNPTHHACRTGAYYDKAIALSTRKLSFLNKATVGPFICIVLQEVAIALLWFLLSCWHKCLIPKTSDKTHPINTNNQKGKNDKNTFQSRTYLIFNAVSIIMLILLSGDIQLNPGPTHRQTNSNKISIIHLNANRIKNKIDQIELQTKDIDIITVSETWLTPDINDDTITLKGFHKPIRKDREGEGGGVAIYVKDNLILKPRPDLNLQNLEAVWVETKIDNDKLIVGSFYRPGSKPVSYWDLVDQSIKKVASTGNRFIVLGDFNTNYLHNPSKHLLDIISLNNLHQLITTPTRYTDTTATCLDLILTPMEDIIKEVGVLTPICSDHSVPFIELNTHTPRAKSYKKTIYNYSNIDIEKLNNLLSHSNLTEIALTGDIDSAAEEITNAIMTNAGKCMPVKTVKISDRDPPWVNGEVKNLLKKKDTTYKRAKHTNSPIDWDEYRKTRNKYTAVLRKRKADYDTELDFKISNTSNFNDKEWWKTVSSFLKKNGSKSSTIPPLERADGSTIYTALEKAELFNSYFIDQSTIDSDEDAIPDIPHINDEITPLTITNNDVFNILSNLETNKAVGPDLIHNKLLKHCAGILAPPLAILFNRSINEGKFPAIWKTAHVAPIHKKEEKHLVHNYRPISLLSCIGKVMEVCVQKHVLNFLLAHNLITPNQSGFLPTHSTVYQLLDTYNDICSALDRNITTQAIFFDISKAFDKVWHRGLIAKMKAIGIRGQLLAWFEDYLSNRKQAVVIAGEISSYQTIQAGVPQGSVLGPTLFLIYINDIVQSIESTAKLFADDTNLYLSLEDPKERAELLNGDLKRIAEWAKKWKVTFNPIKTELVNFSRKLHPQYEPLHFDENELIPSTSHKHLGLTLQSDGKWDRHIINLIAKCRMLVSVLKSLKYRLSRRSLEIIYKSFILPHFDYCDVIWDNCTSTLANDLEEIHRDALRTIIGTVKGTSHKTIYRESGFPALKERRRRHKLILYFKIINKHTPAFLNDLLPPLISDVNPYHRRRLYDRRIPACKTELYKSSFFPSTTLLWNSLPIDIQTSTSLSQFKNFLKSTDHTPQPYYYLGDRRAQIIHTRLRINMSDLNSHLVSRHISDETKCTCGYNSETPRHYLIDCPKYERARNSTINTLQTDMIKTNLLLHRNRNLSIQTNTEIINTTLNFIQMSERFA